MRAMNHPPEADDGRLRAGLAWARNALARPDLKGAPLAGDASFRRYFRLRDSDAAFVLMDAPPDREDTRPFIDVAARLREAGVHAPRVEAADPAQGFLVLEDLGDTLFREVLNSSSVDRWFPRLFDLLARLALDVNASGLPPYDRERMRQELNLFPDWYLEQHQGIVLEGADREVWEALCDALLDEARSQAQVFVHRDFHSCNLLRLSGDGIGVIDFQDAVRGPLAYDFASLVWDRYLSWPRSRLEEWMEDFRRRVAPDTASGNWIRQVDWVGLQRNLKIVGIFARLHHRDGKAGYLELIPRFWGYVMDVLPRYDRFRDFHRLLERLSCAP